MTVTEKALGSLAAIFAIIALGLSFWIGELREEKANLASKLDMTEQALKLQFENYSNLEAENAKLRAQITGSAPLGGPRGGIIDTIVGTKDMAALGLSFKAMVNTDDRDQKLIAFVAFVESLSVRMNWEGAAVAHKVIAAGVKDPEAAAALKDFVARTFVRK